MVYVWQPNPRAQIVVTHGGIDYTFPSDSSSIVVRRHENGFDTGTVMLEDDNAKNYIDKVTADDAISIRQKDENAVAWTEILKGIIRRVEPNLTAQGNFLRLECDGAGYGLEAMLCGGEYGTQSTGGASVDTIKEILEDAIYGIVPKWLNKLLATATDSGFSYTTQIETIAGTINYVYFPYKPCYKGINDICDIVQGAKGALAGPHWIVDTSSRILVATVGNHGAPASTYWPTWWNTDQAGSTLAEGKDFVDFKYEHLAKDANYVLYHGRVIKPLDLDSWTENNAASWTNLTAGSVADDASGKVGAAIKVISNHTGGPVPELEMAVYPTTDDLDLNITNMGGEYDVPVFHVWSKIDAATYAINNGFWFTFRDSDNDFYSVGSYFSNEMFAAADRWAEFTIPIGPNWMKAMQNSPSWYEGPSVGMMTPQWSDIQQIGINYYMDGDDWEVWADNWYISGSVMRGARQAAAYSSSDPCRMKLITDNVAKDDSCNVNDDSGTLARLAYAELLRRQTTPIVGTFTILIAPDLLPGQKLHVHAKKQANGSFRIDKDFRVTRIIHQISNRGFYSVVDVSDDLVNARVRDMPTLLNTALQAVRPEFQDRQATSIKAREIDVTQPILEVSY